MTISKVTPRQFVLLRCKSAFCETNGPDFQVVVLGKFAVATVLGFGHTRRDAWRSAARYFGKRDF